MEDAQTLAEPAGLAMVLIGGIAGWVAGRVTRSNYDMVTCVLVGVAGAYVGMEIGKFVHVPVFGFMRTLIAATIGAALILVFWRVVLRR